MSLGWMSLILLGIFCVLLVIGMEIAVAIGMTAAVGLLLFVHQPLTQFAYSGWNTMYSFILTAVPAFIFMGTMFAETGVIRKLFSGVDRLVRFLPGAVATSVIAANAIFGAISGSSVAATATFGKIAVPEMERLGYNPKLSLGVIAVGGSLSLLIPPSLVLIIYGGWLQVSVSQLFAGALIPGIVLSLLLILMVIVMVMINPSLAPKGPKSSGREKLRALLDVLPFLLVIFVVLGVIFGGIMTPTEAASIGAVLSILLALAYRTMSFKALKTSLRDAMKVTAMIAFVLLAARVLGQVFQYIGLTEAFSSYMMGLPWGKYGVMAAICVMYIILGCFLDGISMLILTMPFIGPLVSGLGYSLVWFGIMYAILNNIGLVTPPFGLNLFVLKSVAPKYDIMTIAAGCIPFIVPQLAMLVVLIAFPQLVLWLPSVLY